MVNNKKVVVVRPLKKGRRGRRKTGYGKSVKALTKKVIKLENSLKKDVEVKTCYVDTVNLTVGQVNIDVTGTQIVNLSDMFLTSSSVSGASGRIGLKAKAIGFYIRGQLRQQSSTASAMRLRVEVFKTHDMATALTTVLSRIYDADTISGVVDYNSNRHVNFRDIYKRIYKKDIYLPDDSVSGLSTIRDYKMFIKQNQQIEYQTSNFSEPVNVRYFMVIRANIGNCSTTTNSTNPNIGITSMLTGARFLYSGVGYYTDM